MARENRLVPEYVEEFSRRAAKMLDVKMEKREDGLWRITSVPFTIRNQPHEFRIKFGEVQKEYAKISFDKEKAFKGQAEFVAMGHPLLESIVNIILSQFAQSALDGATFTDPEGKRDGIIWFLEAEIKDGRNETAGKRLFAVYHGLETSLCVPHRQGSEQPLSFVNPAIIWDLKPLIKKEQLKTTGLQYQASETDILKSFVISKGLENYKKELLERRQRDAEIKRKYGIRSLESMILESDAKISEYETRRMKGENIPEATIQNEVRKKEDLERKKQRLLREIEAEIHLYPTDPRIIGAVRVLPGKVEGEMIADEGIEQIGMKFVMEYEKRQGRVPEDVHLENLGYDIRSRDKMENYRYIEVKARVGEGAVTLTPNEWLMAQRLKDEYWLYVVVNAATNPELYILQNPAAKLEPDKEIDIVRYVVKKLKEKAEVAK